MLREQAAQIKRAAEQASNLPKQLLAFSREQVLEPRLVDVDAVVGDAVGLVNRLIGDSVELVLRQEATSALVEADPSELEQLILNLAVNASHAMPDGGRLVIRTGNEEVDSESAARNGVAPGRFVVLAVEDSGVGMDDATRSRVFEPFFTTKPQGEGSGLGLAGVYGVVTQSGGFVQLETTVGEGSTFRLYFPSAGPRQGHRPTVLVAEDEEIVRDLVQLTLERAGYRVLAASDGDEALALRTSSDEPIDILLTDMVMPGMNGAELAQRVLAASPQTPVVFMSGYTTRTRCPRRRAATTSARCSRSPFRWRRSSSGSRPSSRRRGLPRRHCPIPSRPSPSASCRCWRSSPTVTPTTARRPSSGSRPRPCRPTFET